MIDDQMQTGDMLIEAVSAPRAPGAATAILDLHGFEKSMTVPWPAPYELNIPIPHRLFGAGIADNDILVGNEELLSLFAIRFTRRGSSADGVVRYTCAGCLLCQRGLIDSFIAKLAREAAKEVLYQQGERRRADARERAEARAQKTEAKRRKTRRTR